MLFLDELEQVLEHCEISATSPFSCKLFRRLVKCATGDNFSVVERTKRLFEVESFKKKVKACKPASFLIIVPLVSRMAERHINL